MTDRELLELAAKAAGYEVRSDGEGGLTIPTRRGACREWNPLEDDGDALRLAIILKLRIFTCQGCFGNITAVGMPEEYDLDSVSERHNDDPYSATRRAITRAAAEIGRVET